LEEIVMVPEKTCARLALFALFVTTLFAFCPRVLGQAEPFVSLIQLIANPEKYDGKQVQVTGFLRLEFEGNRIFLHKEDYTYNIVENAVRIGVTKEQGQDLKDKNMHYVSVVGTFKAGKRGTSNPNGTILKIAAVDLWPPNERPN
jgi:uncharacterized membrane protein YcgQ (UPF0703/DUF1980 family)